MTAPEHPSLDGPLSLQWPAIEEAAHSLHLDSGGTIMAALPGMTTTRGERALAALLPMLSGLDTRRVTLHDTLGQGGMGVVRLGTQTTLDRRVAVKAVRPDRRSPDSTIKLLQEAFIAGALEHPNIVPVYDISRDADGEPLILQQRIEGESWSDLLEDPEAIQRRFGVTDLLDWNLRVFLQVCNAAHFAHARGIVHLDLKPGNVMIGSFGEVRVLDWGLAMSLRDDGTGRLPLAAENQEIIGTPSYMAPEMLSQDGRLLSPRTDVYLLGATLHHLCVGAPPHQGSSTLAILYQVATKPVAAPLGVPEELAAICSRAMEREPTARYSSAAELRLAVQGFLDHRGALRIAEEAAREADALRDLLSAGERDPAVIRPRFAAARFGFESALAAWAGNDEARQGLRTLRIDMARHELSVDDPRAAAGLLAEIDDPPADLAGAVAAAVRALDEVGARVERLQEFRDQQDPRIGQRTRVFIMSLLGLLWTLLPATRAIWGNEDAWRSFFLAPFLFGALLGGLLYWARESMTRTAVNRRTAWSVATLLVFQEFLVATAWRLDLPVDALLPLMMVLWGTIATMTAIAVDRRLLPTALAQVVALLITLTHPAWGWWAATGANLAFLVNGLVVWRPTPLHRPSPKPEPDVVPPPRRR